jgi:uncharacterized protein (TIGR03000 family)
MRRMALLLALSSVVALVAADAAQAGRRGCGGGRSRGGSRGGCSSGGCSSGGCSSGGCHTGGVVHSGGTCSTGACGVGGHAMSALDGTAVADAKAPVTLVVTLAADATLTVDGQATTSTSGTRTFFSPPLKAGVEYTYTLKAEVTRDGASRTVCKDVTVRAGEETRVSLDLPVAGVASR